MDPEELGLGLGSGLLNNLKQTVVMLASNAGVLNTVQAAAQAVLQSGWSVLLPTAEERARALSSLLPNAGEWGAGWTLVGLVVVVMMVIAELEPESIQKNNKKRRLKFQLKVLPHHSLIISTYQHLILFNIFALVLSHLALAYLV